MVSSTLYSLLRIHLSRPAKIALIVLGILPANLPVSTAVGFNASSYICGFFSITLPILEIIGLVSFVIVTQPFINILKYYIKD